MDNIVKIAISSDFLSSFAALPRQVQRKVTEFIGKFKSDPKSPGINLEKIKDGTDKNMRSIRIDNTYRGVLLKQEESDVYLLLWVDHHDEAYEWASITLHGTIDDYFTPWNAPIRSKERTSR